MSAEERRAPAWKLTTAQISALLGATMFIENRLTKVETEVHQLRVEVSTLSRPAASNVKPRVAAVKETYSYRVQDGFGARLGVQGAPHGGGHDGEGGGALRVLEGAAGAHAPRGVTDRAR